ncbi:MAG: EI24 domain-containing protein [Burkholderiales bacterium]|nr:EI24 domain-containing protein [Burkholderiales bacterium]
MFQALSRALVSQLHPKMLFLMLWPVLLATFAWAVLALLFGAQAVRWVDGALKSSQTVQWMLEFWPLALLAAHLAVVVLALAFVPLVLVTAVLIVGVFAMQAIVDHVAQRDYPGLQRRHGGGFAASLGNSLLALAAFIALALISLPLWLVPALWPVLPVLLFAYLNQRVFRFDALAEHADASELREIARRDRAELFLLGIAVAVVGHVPLLGFFAPVYGGLVFTHYGLARLRALRGEPIEGRAVRS